MFSLDQQPLVVAELGMTHDGSFGLATRLTEEAIKSGAHVVKYQWHIAEAETLIDAPSPSYFTLETRYEYFTRTSFTLEQFKQLVQLCKSKGCIPCVSVFSIESVHLAVKAGFEILKIPSGEVTNIPLLRSVVNTNLPVIMSSGMSSWSELDSAMSIFPENYSICLMQCTSLYPTPAEKVGLNVIQEMYSRYNCVVGLSDHTLGSATCVAAMTLGARVFEKHFTISKSLYGPDARFSLEPKVFSQLVSDLAYTHKSLTVTVDKDNLTDFQDMKKVFQKSIVAKSNILAGEQLTMDNIAFKKPGTGIPPSMTDQILGKKASIDIFKDQMISLDILL